MNAQFTKVKFDYFIHAPTSNSSRTCNAYIDCTLRTKTTISWERENGSYVACAQFWCSPFYFERVDCWKRKRCCCLLYNGTLNHHHHHLQFHQSFERYFFPILTKCANCESVFLCECVYSTNSFEINSICICSFIHLHQNTTFFYMYILYLLGIQLVWLGLNLLGLVWRCAILTSRKVKDDDFGSQR